jgi:hypothetical protein
MSIHSWLEAKVKGANEMKNDTVGSNLIPNHYNYYNPLQTMACHHLLLAV